MKKFTKFAALACAVVFCLSLSACGNKDGEASDDLSYIKEKGTLVVGITDFEPMDYKDDKGNWIGFDADLATTFAEELGVKVEFVEIDWDSKELELNNKSIDCVWNGMTITDGVVEAMGVSNSYLNNSQVVVMKADKIGDYPDAASMKDLTFAVENGSAGADVASENGFKVTAVETQAAALMEVEAGTSDACIIDLLMAGAMTGAGTSYGDLKYSLKLTDEEYGVGFRKGSNLVSEFNEFFKVKLEDGKVEEIAKKYNIPVDAIVK